MCISWIGIRFNSCRSYISTFEVLGTTIECLFDTSLDPQALVYRGRQPQNLLKVCSAGLPSQTLTDFRSGECHHLQHLKFERYLANSCLLVRPWPRRGCARDYCFGYRTVLCQPRHLSFKDNPPQSPYPPCLLVRNLVP
jgi:hypothetical protein